MDEEYGIYCHKRKQYLSLDGWVDSAYKMTHVPLGMAEIEKEYLDREGETGIEIMTRETAEMRGVLES